MWEARGMGTQHSMAAGDDAMLTPTASCRPPPEMTSTQVAVTDRPGCGLQPFHLAAM